MKRVNKNKTTYDEIVMHFSICYDYGYIYLTFSLPYMTVRNHKMTQIFVKYILHLCIFRHLKLEIALAIPASNDEK